MSLLSKVLEIRDAGTFIPVIAIQMVSADPVQDYYLSRMGFGHAYPSVTVMRLNDQKATCDIYEWFSLTGNTCTMQVAHDWIDKHFAELKDGDVVDVEFILGQRDQPKQSERFLHDKA